MRSLIIAAVLFGVLSAEKCDTDVSVYSVKLRLTETSTYCGGAAPPDDLIRELRTPKPFRGNQPLYLLDSNEVCIDSIHPSGQDSTYQLNLPAGNWTIRYKQKIAENHGKTERERCLHDWKHRKLAEFQILQDTAITVNIHKDCNPCYPPPP
ncbi:MAG: hypothetical protein JJ975_10305 [Bacteroidia bacterium]|nr:hypothetical protein [Bacteroidia bacterium]